VNIFNYSLSNKLALSVVLFRFGDSRCLKMSMKYLEFKTTLYIGSKRSLVCILWRITSVGALVSIEACFQIRRNLTASQENDIKSSFIYQEAQ
jgi:hypothetical protein